MFDEKVHKSQLAVCLTMTAEMSLKVILF